MENRVSIFEEEMKDKEFRKLYCREHVNMNLEELYCEIKGKVTLEKFVGLTLEEISDIFFELGVKLDIKATGVNN